MNKQRVIWTALPNGISRRADQTFLKMSVFVSPRLMLDSPAGTGTLDKFPNYLDWPAQVQPARFAIRVLVDNNEASPVPTRIVTEPSVDTALWTALFSASTPVKSHAFANEREPVSSYDTRNIQSQLYRGYGTVGKASPFKSADKALLERAFPTVFAAFDSANAPQLIDVDNVDSLSEAQLINSHRELSDALLKRQETASFNGKLTVAMRVAGALCRSSLGPVPLVPRTADPVSVLSQFAAFHRRSLPPDMTASDRTEADETNEFHSTLTTLGEYPHLLRRLGLIIDVEIDAERVPDSGAGRLHRLKVQPVFNGQVDTRNAYSPNTYYLLSRDLSGALPLPTFAAAPRGSEIADQPASTRSNGEIVDGLLNLTRTDGSDTDAAEYGLVQIDIDGALSKVMNTVEGLVADANRPHPIDKASEEGAPAFRTSGLSLVRASHADHLIKERDRAAQYEQLLRQGVSADLFADDLVRGYRIDIKRVAQTETSLEFPSAAPPTWLSLNHRLGTYTLRGGDASALVARIADEGFTQPAFVQNRRPALNSGGTNPYYIQESLFHWTGWSLSVPPPANPSDLVEPVPSSKDEAPGALPLNVDFEPVDGSLPRLRFGSRYQVRARCADLAGNGPNGKDADEALSVLGAQGGAVPVLGDDDGIPYLRFDPVATPELVFREEPTEGESVDVMIIRSDGSTAAAYAQSLGDRRYKGICERHIVPPKASLTTAELHGMLDRAFGPGANPGGLYNLCQRERGTLADPFLINTETGAQQPLPDQVAGAGSQAVTIRNGIRFIQLQPPRGADGYAIHYEPQLKVPYLPDPMARGAAIFGLPGIQGGSGALDANDDLKYTRQILSVPALRDLGLVTKINYGNAGNWPDMKPFRLVLGEIAGSETPRPPHWNKQTRELTVFLAPGQTRTIWISSHPNLEDVDLFGLYDWWLKQNTSPVDEMHFLKMASHGALVMLTPPRKVVLMHAVQRPVKPPIESTDRFFDQIRYENDTVAYLTGAFKIHANSTAKIDVVADWDEPVEEAGVDRRQSFHTHVFEVPIPPPLVPAGETPIATFNKDTERLEFVVPDSVHAPGAHFKARHEFGDTKHRKVKYTLSAATRFQECFPTRITQVHDNLVAKTDPFTVLILSSAKPPPPEISHIVPAFGWITDDDGTAVTQSVRRGGGLRVYLGDTWFASGDGEQLAVIEAEQMNRWGVDPTHVLAATTANVIKPDAPAANAPGSIYHRKLHPFKVSFDRESKLWYCDITFRVGNAYFPFRELALARYQKNSLPGLQVSSIVRAGIYQLAPDRMVSLVHTPLGSGQRKVKITISASAVRGAADSPERADTTAVEVVLEQRAAARANWDADLGWSAAEPARQPVADRPPLQGQLWTGQLTLAAADGAQRRLVIREYELFPSSGVAPGQAWIGEPPGASRRIVYADTIRLP